MIISLSGFMGSGKSVVGRELSKKLDFRFVDLDEYLVESQGMSVPQIFSAYGETKFRLLECGALGEILASDDDIVLSLGGGTLTFDESARRVIASTRCVFLRAGVDTLASNLSKGVGGRPVLMQAIERIDRSSGGYMPIPPEIRPGDPDSQRLKSAISSLLAGREPSYRRNAHLIVDVDGKTPDRIAQEIMELLY